MSISTVSTSIYDGIFDEVLLRMRSPDGVNVDLVNLLSEHGHNQDFSGSDLDKIGEILRERYIERVGQIASHFLLGEEGGILFYHEGERLMAIKDSDMERDGKKRISEQEPYFTNYARYELWLEEDEEYIGTPEQKASVLQGLYEQMSENQALLTNVPSPANLSQE